MKHRSHFEVTITVFLVVILLVCIGVLSAGAGESLPIKALQKVYSVPVAEDPPEDDPVDISGSTVTVLGNMASDQIQPTFDLFEQQTGANIFYMHGEAQVQIWDMLNSGEVPDVVFFPQPGVARQLAADGQVIDLNTFLDAEFLEANYKSDWLEMGTYNDQLIGLFLSANVKSLVWYPVDAFQRAGYKIPETWDELVALSDQIVADGKTPWCIGFQDGPWVITDWMEDAMLRLHGKEVYDQWINGELAFNSPEVKQAAELIGEIFFAEGYTVGGQDGLVNTPWWDSIQGILSDPPGCFMHRQASFITFAFPPELVIGREVDFFYLPPVVTESESDTTKPVLIGGDMVTMFQDRPEVREFVKFLGTAESIEPVINQGGFVSPHIGPAIDWYPTYSDREYAQMLLDADVIRFDGSDMMPNQVGNEAFWGGMVEYVNGEDLETVLQMIDDSWPR